MLNRLRHETRLPGGWREGLRRTRSLKCGGISPALRLAAACNGTGATH